VDCSFYSFQGRALGREKNKSPTSNDPLHSIVVSTRAATEGRPYGFFVPEVCLGTRATDVV